MSKEEIDLLKVQLLLDYYKNKDITQHYRTLIENNIVFDNDTLDVLNDINETIYITKFDKHIKLQQENKILKENAENNDKVVDKVNWENQLLKKENEQLKDNWNDLKKYAKEVISTDNELYGTDLLDKMLELEKAKVDK